MNDKEKLRMPKNLEKIVVSEGMYCFGVRLTRAIFVLSKNRLGVMAPLSLFRYHDFSLVFQYLAKNLEKRSIININM